jgi:hypothetical protein
MMSDSKCIPQRKRLAMGQKLAGGGMVKTPTGAGSMVSKPGKGLPRSPLENARRNNGIPHMKKGGPVK